MFIYHFSKLIRSKLLWAFLALLMVFSFVVMDSCSGTAGGPLAAGYIDGDTVDAKAADDASQTVTLLTGSNVFYLPRQSQLFAYLLRGDAYGEIPWQERRRMAWAILAARRVAADNGLTLTDRGVREALMARFADPEGNFSPDAYRAFLAVNGYRTPKLFENTYGSVWFPAEAVTCAVMNAAGWASPMEQNFELSARLDTVTARLLTLTRDGAPADVAPDAVRAWYDTHAEDYAVPETREIACVEIPVAPFVEKVTVEELDAMQYHDDHPELFKGTDTNGNAVTLPFEEVRDKAIAKVRGERALEDALRHANEALLPTVAAAKSVAALAETYGEPKTLILRRDTLPDLQNPSAVLDAAFEMDPEYTPLNAIAGTDRVYLFALTKVTPPHTAPFEDVREEAAAAARKDAAAKSLKADSEALRAALADALAKGTALDDAVKTLGDGALTLGEPFTFVLDDAEKPDIPEARRVTSVASETAVGALSEPILAEGTAYIVCVTDRTPGDALRKITARQDTVRGLTMASGFTVAGDWLRWNLDRCPPADIDGNPILEGDDALPEE